MQHIIKLSVEDLKQQWRVQWGKAVPAHIGRVMLEKSLAYKLQQLDGKGLNDADQTKLDRFIKNYKRNPNCFEQELGPQSTGTRLVRKWHGVEHEVLVTERGYQYRNINYTSLSKIAFLITGTRWNGLVFFGLKQRAGAKNKKVIQ